MAGAKERERLKIHSQSEINHLSVLNKYIRIININTADACSELIQGQIVM